MRRIVSVLVATAILVLVATTALASPAFAQGDGATFAANSCGNLHTIVPPAPFAIEINQGTTVTTPSNQDICAPKPTGGKNQTGGGGGVPI
jgi:hypothetical protein